MTRLAIIAALAAVSAAATAEAAPITLSTGSAAWQVKQTAGASNNGAALNTITSGVVLTGNLPAPWIAPPAGSAWIGQRANDGQFQSGGNDDGATDGTYEYTLTWNPGGGGTFSFSFSADNTISSLSVIQSGNTLFSFSSNAITDFATLINTGVVNFASLGNVVITAVIVNQPSSGNSRNPAGFLVAGTADVIDATEVPLPAAAAILPLGLAFLGAAARPRKKA